MKKFILILIPILLFIVRVNANKIPSDAIRIRVIANSDSEYDQQIKHKISDYLKSEMYFLLKDTKTKEEANKIIENNINKIDNNIYSILKKENYNLGYTINYGKNYFPEKKYKGMTYEEGYYDSLLITLGKGEGENWWCVLFPPLCLIEAEESEKIEYNFFLFDIVKDLFNL